MYRLLTHNDLDGVACGVLAKLAFENQVQVRYNSITGLNHEVEWFLENGGKDTFLLITDLTVNEENEKRLNKFHHEGGKLQLLDHHKSALHFNKYDWSQIIVEDNEGNLTSAASLLYEYLVNHGLMNASLAVAEFVELVRQYDTWEWEKNNTQDAQRLNALFFLLSIDEFEEKMISRLTASQHFFFDEFETKLLNMEENKIERYIRRKRRELTQASIGKYIAGIVYAESYHSELGNELGKEYPHLDYIAIINMSSKRIGFRTIHDHVDVSQIAGEFGGGGHAKASGCSLTEETYNKFVMDTFHLDSIREDAKRNRYNVNGASFGTLYTNRTEETFLLHPLNDKWVIKSPKLNIQKSFSSFQEGECFLKRNYAVSLVRDDVFVNYLMDLAKPIGERQITVE